jgi:asparagine synthase (glutamine-hydrolysing)
MPDVSSFSYYCVSRLAADHVKVSLTGHGGDEIFAGYPAQFEATFGDASMFQRVHRMSSPRTLATHFQLSLRRHGALGAIRRALGRRLGRTHNDLEHKWLQLHCSLAPADNPLLSDGFRAQLAGYDPREDYLAPLRHAPTAEVLDKCLYHDLRCYLPALLYQEDRASMSVSLESRVPLLDHRLIEFLATVPPAQKVADRTPKNLLRRFNQGRLPPQVVNRHNKGSFTVPIESWFNGELAPLLERTVFSPAALRRGLFDQQELRSGWHGVNGYWSALSLEVWFRLFIDQDREWLDLVEASSSRPAPVESEPAERVVQA